MASELAQKWAERMVVSKQWRGFSQADFGSVELRIGDERILLEDNAIPQVIATELTCWRSALADLLDAFHAEAIAKAAPPAERLADTGPMTAFHDTDRAPAPVFADSDVEG